jgi:hypothetical protein
MVNIWYVIAVLLIYIISGVKISCRWFVLFVKFP